MLLWEATRRSRPSESVHDVGMERCDRCVAEGQVTVVRVSSPEPGERPATLVLCGHHFALHEIALLLAHFAIVEDNRASLTGV